MKIAYHIQASLVATVMIQYAISAPQLQRGAPRVAYAGVNIAGCDFGLDVNGNAAGCNCPTTIGPAQMQHFSRDDHLNIFRLPVGWQYLLNHNLGGPLDEKFFGTYNKLMQACLATGAKCILDIHNYARWNGGIIAQGGPSNEQFGNLWAQLAQRYASQSNVIFGLMNEPHDLDMNAWAASLQNAVYAIRANGARSQTILLSGTNFDAAGGFQYTSAPALATIQDYDGSRDKLIYEVHQYLDGAGGSKAECVTNGVEDSLAGLTSYLRSVGRKGILAETGGGNVPSCQTDVCAELSHMNYNSDVWLGWVGWAAGSFQSSYVLSEVPQGNQDTALVSSCIAGKFNNPP